MSRLVTERASRAEADQRRGRAMAAPPLHPRVAAMVVAAAPEQAGAERSARAIRAARLSGIVIPVSAGVHVAIATRPVDFRKGHDGPAPVVQETLRLDPFCGAEFIFRSKRADRSKLLVWDGTGLVRAHEPLENGKFAWPKVADGTMKLTPGRFPALFEGLDWRAVRAERHPRPTSAG